MDKDKENERIWRKKKEWKKCLKKTKMEKEKENERKRRKTKERQRHR